MSVEWGPTELQRRVSRCMDFVARAQPTVARAQPTGEFRPKWKRLVATAIARLRFSLATASSHRARLKRRTKIILILMSQMRDASVCPRFFLRHIRSLVIAAP